jgi:hypothetical protein
LFTFRKLDSRFFSTLPEQFHLPHGVVLEAGAADISILGRGMKMELQKYRYWAGVGV